MKIGLLTLPLNYNSGGILQAYALQKVLINLGHDCIVINQPYKKSKLPKSRRFLVYIVRFIRKYIFGRSYFVFREKKVFDEYPYLNKNVDSFIKRNMKCIYTEKLNELNHLFDAIVVGSDQIWRPLYYSNIEDAFLKFATSWEIRRVAYAASFGVDQWEYSKRQTKRCTGLLTLFDAISVREFSGIKLCRENLGVEAQLVLDPTLLLDKKFYINLFSKKNLNHSGFLLSYILDECSEKEEIIHFFASKYKLTNFRINNDRYDFSRPIEDRVSPSIEDWLYSFYQAKFVVTDSFHGCVFSILFNKPFFVYGNKERGFTRFISLLNLFSLEDRFVASVDECKLKLDNEINWDLVNSRLDEMRKTSISFLKNAL